MHSWNPWKLKIFLYLVWSANEREAEWRGIKIKRGQTFRSLNTITDGVSYIIQYSSDMNRSKKPSISTVKRILDDLKMKRLIDIKVERSGMLITINDYEYLSTAPITKMANQSLGKVVKQKRPRNEGPQWMREAGLI